MKVSILGGAGTLGSTSAFVLAQQNVVDEICLIDVNENLAKNHEFDMGMAALDFSRTKITSGGFDKLEGSEIVINMVGGGTKNVNSRMAHLENNLEILSQVSEHIMNYTSNPIIITVTNPMDIINTMTYDFTAISPERLIGFSLNDSFRFRLAISQTLQVDFSTVSAHVVGEHGEEQCPIFSRIEVDKNIVELNNEQRAQVLSFIRNHFSKVKSLNSGRTSGWLSSINIAKLVNAIIQDSNEVVACSVMRPDEVSVGRLVRLGRQGVSEILDMQLTEEEEQKWMNAKNKITRIVNELSQRDDQRAGDGQGGHGQAGQRDRYRGTN
ncbi:malate dehydrogenase [Bacillus sp. Marseille-P3661]|uniref:malate dehydrogenase n=1 Tax=Bacillus sp. Marseille-P3661 TaxID=1936234 RepID=UPI000C833764|nr:hypothetical protein [Bacillus sp. Marseille-P3661]